ncbi:glycosyl hydrolase [Tricladium varicosporioides]|nr:glycosyl hydrolase [Hymenoscyphus varicosporioides]
MGSFIRRGVAIGLLFAQSICAIDLDVENRDSVVKAAGVMAKDMVSYYHGAEPGRIPGLLDYPLYWWEAGAMFGALIEYWHYTGDTQYNAITTQAMSFQIGEDKDYAPRNQSASLGNDDQAFWAIAAMAAAEYNFPPSTQPGVPSWLALVQAVFNEQVGRWNTQWCNGGLQWQVIPQNRGYPLKNTISNGCLFQIAARLARYTNDPMYAAWAVKIWDWLYRIGLINDAFQVYDNSEAIQNNCSRLDHNQWTYNAGVMLLGAATMYNYTNGDPIWENRTRGLLDSLPPLFFPNGVMREGCEDAPNVCNDDQKSFKAYLSRWMAITTKMAPFTYNTVYGLLKSSSKAAAAQCNGGSTHTKCGIKWTQNGTWDGTDGVGQQMCALEVTLGLLIKETPPPLTNSTGGTSISNPTAGKNSTLGKLAPTSLITTGDRVGAWFLTVVIVIFAAWSTWFLWSEAWEYRDPTPRLREKSRMAASVVDLSAGGKGKSVAPESMMASGALPTITEDAKARLPRWLGGNRVT